MQASPGIPVRTTFSRIFPVLLLAALLGACGRMPTQPEPPSDPDIARAAALLADKQFQQAEALYEALGSRYSGAKGLEFRLKAVDSSLQGGDLDKAARLLQDLAGSPMTPDQQLYAGILQAELALARHQGDAALDTLLDLYRPQMPRELQLRLLRDQATAYRMVGNLLESANALQRLDAALGNDLQQRLAVQSEILRALTTLSGRTLRELQPSPPGTPGGWMQLALLLKQYAGDPQALAAQLQAWRERFPGHPALPELLQRASERTQARVKLDHVAVLLPTSGRYAAAAKALRDGIMAAYYELPEEQRPTLRFYDSSDPASVWPLYSQAVEAGAQAVIGPLQKDAVGQLLRAGELAVPVLALNHVDGDTAPPHNFYMFALDPEHEAHLAAEFIWQRGLRHPVMLTPDNTWGARLRAAFDERWLALTGSEVDGRAYPPESADFSEAISSLVHLDRSKARHTRIQRWLGQRVEFEPRRRQDIDAVFVAAHPQQAQSMRPQLAFFHAGDLPMVTTSHAWAGTLTPQQLADMRGILLPDIPLIADTSERENLGRQLPAVLGPGVRLYAMGIDAMRLLPHLQRLQASLYEALDGQTGNLFMNHDHQVLRQLVWLRLDSPVQILGYSARMDLETPPDEPADTAETADPDAGAPATRPRDATPPPG